MRTRECFAPSLAALLCACGSVEEPVVAPGWDASRADHCLTRAECVQLALDFAPSAAVWRARLDAATARLDQAGRLPNPTLGVEWEDFGLLTSAESALQTTFPIGISLSEVFARSRRESAANHELEATIAELLVERRKLALSVCTAYDDLVAARRSFALTKELVEVAVRARHAAVRRVAVGLDAPIALARAELELAGLRAQSAEEDIDVGGREMAFAFALGFERPVAIELADDLLSDQGPPQWDVEQLLAEAARTRPELRVAAAHYAAALDRAHLAASVVRFLPHVAAGPRTIGGHTTGVASLEFELPLFDSGDAARAESNAELLAAAAEARQAAHTVTQEVVTAATRVEAEASFLHEHALPLAAKHLELRDRAERQFEAGELDFDALLDIFRAEVSARRDALRARKALAQTAWPIAVDRWLDERQKGIPEPPRDQ